MLEDGVVVTLPAIAFAAGTSYKFILSTAGGVSAIIATAATPIAGQILTGPIAATNPSILITAGALSVVFGATCALGDTLELYGNGVNWLAHGFSASDDLVDGMTFA